MAKRFTDTDKWSKPFIKNLQTPYKLLWFYILDTCDFAGIWQVDFDIARLRIGEKKISLNNAITLLSKHIIPFDDNEKWFIPAFIDFQYGSLNPANRAHNSIIQKLKKYNLIDENNKPLSSPLVAPCKPLVSPSQGRKDKEQYINNTVSKNKEEESKLLILKEEEEKFDKFNSWIKENTPSVLKMQKPITLREFLKLQERFTSKNDRERVLKKLQAMDNKPDLLKKYKSAYRTLLDWMEMPDLNGREPEIKFPTEKTAKELIGENIMLAIENGKN